MNQATLPPNSTIRVERLDVLLKKTLDRRTSLRATRGSRVSPLDPIHARIGVIAAVLAWALRNSDAPPSVVRCSAMLGLLRNPPNAKTETSLKDLVERVYVWTIAVACELLSLEYQGFDIEEEAAQFEMYAPRAIALLDETVGPLLEAQADDDLALASIRRIVADLRQTLVLCTTPAAVMIAA